MLRDLIFSQSQSQSQSQEPLSYNRNSTTAKVSDRNPTVSDVSFSSSDSDDSVKEEDKPASKKRKMLTRFSGTYPLHDDFKKMPELYRNSPMVFFSAGTRSAERHKFKYAPNLCSYVRFPQHETPVSLTYRSMLKELWNDCYHSHDHDGAEKILPVFLNMSSVEVDDFKRCVTLLLSRKQYSTTAERPAKVEVIRNLSTICLNYKMVGILSRSVTAVEVRRSLLEFFIGLLVDHEDIQHAELLLNDRLTDKAVLESPLLMQYIALIGCLKGIKYAHALYRAWLVAVCDMQAAANGVSILAPANADSNVTFPSLPVQSNSLDIAKCPLLFKEIIMTLNNRDLHSFLLRAAAASGVDLTNDTSHSSWYPKVQDCTRLINELRYSLLHVVSGAGKTLSADMHAYYAGYLEGLNKKSEALGHLVAMANEFREHDSGIPSSFHRLVARYICLVKSAGVLTTLSSPITHTTAVVEQPNPRIAKYITQWLHSLCRESEGSGGMSGKLFDPEAVYCAVLLHQLHVLDRGDVIVMKVLLNAIETSSAIAQAPIARYTCMNSGMFKRQPDYLDNSTTDYHWSLWRNLANMLGPVGSQPPQPNVLVDVNNSDIIHPVIVQFNNRIERRTRRTRDDSSDPQEEEVHLGNGEDNNGGDAQDGVGAGDEARRSLLRGREWWQHSILSVDQLGSLTFGVTGHDAKLCISQIQGDEGDHLLGLGCVRKKTQLSGLYGWTTVQAPKSNDTSSCDLSSPRSLNTGATHSIVSPDGSSDDDEEDGSIDSASSGSSSSDQDLSNEHQLYNSKQPNGCDIGFLDDRSWVDGTYRICAQQFSVGVSSCVNGLHKNAARVKVLGGKRVALNCYDHEPTLWVELLRVCALGGSYSPAFSYLTDIPSASIVRDLVVLREKQSDVSISYSTRRSLYYPLISDAATDISRRHCNGLCATSHHQEVTMFTELSDGLLEILTFQIIVCCHINRVLMSDQSEITGATSSQDFVFVIRGIQILVQHRERGYACVALLMYRFNIDIARAISLANLMADHVDV